MTYILKNLLIISDNTATTQNPYNPSTTVEILIAAGNKKKLKTISKVRL